jgi:enoyl-CoA hydratase
MDLKDVLYVKRGPLAWVTLNRPRVLNALTPEVLQSLRCAFEEARDDEGVRVVAITGAGRAFCAGADIQVMNDASLADFRDFLGLLTDVWTFIRTFPKPTIAAINGVVVGGGFELALICDFRIAAKPARLGSAEVRINQPMTNGATYLLSRLIGEGRARALAMTGDLIDAEEAERIGLVNAVFQPDALERQVEDLAHKLSRGGPIALSLVKRCFERNRHVDIDTAIMVENEAGMACFVSADQKEGLRAFLEKREPQWSGR